MTKLSLTQIDEAMNLTDHYFDGEDGCEMSDLTPLDHEIDETVYRTTYQRKELRSNRQREEGELIGKGSIRKHRKY